MMEPLTRAVSGSSPVMALAIIDLPEPDDPTRPTRSPSAMSMHDIAHDGFVVDGDGQPTNLDAHAASLNAGLANGSSASRRASPNRFSAITTSVTTSPGHSTAIG